MMKRTFILIFIAAIILWCILFAQLNINVERTKLQDKDNIEKLMVSANSISNQKYFTKKTLHNEGEIVVSTLSGIHVQTFSNVHGNITEYRSLNKSNRRREQVIKEGNYKSCSGREAMSVRVRQFPQDFSYFKDTFIIEREPIKSWVSEKASKTFCDGNVRIYDNRFVLLHNVILDMSKRKNANNMPKGGEPLQDVLGQKETMEFFGYSKGFWKVQCISNDIPAGNGYPWLKYLDKQINEPADVTIVETNYTLAVTRLDYVNMHNVIRQLYNAFVLMMFLKKQPKDISVLFLDGHPVGMLDQLWIDIFGHVYRAGSLSQPVIYRNMIWGFKESDGELSNIKSGMLSYGEEFRSFFLQQYYVNQSSTLDCEQVTITINLRRDKVFHPRNTNGIIGRKIFNDAEIISDLLKHFPKACVQGILMDSLPMRSQLEIISTTDIFIGMHGAGMTHTLFLPEHAAVLEIFPKDFKKSRPWYICYEKIANWRSLKYDSWENFDKSLEMPFDYLILPREIIIEKVKRLMNSLCPTD